MRSVQPVPTVLVVDDTPSIQQLLIHTLRDIVPYEILAVTDAAAALAVLSERPVPMLITDYHLPDMRGDALVAAVKTASPDTKVLMITADIAIDASAEWPDVDRCLIKPFPLRELVAAVSSLLPIKERAR
jgi:putative two-component system response regulator